MAQELFVSSKGFADSRIYIISGAGVPGTTTDTNAAGVGSIYSDISTAIIYKKDTAGSGTDKWSALASGGSAAAHIAASSGVHGATGTIVGTTDTQTLTNKTIDGAAIVSTETAGEALSGYVGAVLISGGVFTFDNTNAAHLGTVEGVTTQAASSGAPVVIQAGGKLTNAGWALTEGRVYLSATGQITNSAPASGIMQSIGFAISSTVIVIGITNPIQQV